MGTYLRDHPATLAIGAGELAFWVFLLAGLAVRYLVRWRRTCTVILLALPVIDLVVLTVSMLDLAGGAKANLSHGLAAVYLGFSVVFGASLVRWADLRFAYRFAGGPPPPPKRTGRDRARYEWREWGKCVLACGIAAGLLLAAILLIGRPEQMAPLWNWMSRLGAIVGFWLLVGPVWQELFGRSSAPVRQG